MKNLDRPYQIVKDINGYRVIFDDPSINPHNYNDVQHKTPSEAGRWALEMLTLHYDGV